MSDLLTLQEVAQILGVRADLLRVWRYRKTGPKSFKIGVAVVYRRRDVEKWQAEQREAKSA
jgi:predicted DNA-binding transcriptional regulator AlpA